MSRLLWIAMAALIVVFGIQARDQIEFYFAGVGSLDVRRSDGDDTVYLTWRGNVDAPMAQRLSEAYEQNKSARRFVLTLNSPGGSLGHGAEVVRLLKRMSETHELETRVEARRRCASMCVPVFLQGQRRVAAGSAKFMFHEVSFREHHTDRELDVPDTAKAVVTDRFFETYFTPAGVPGAWIRQVRGDMAGGHDVWKSARELADEHAGIVLEVL